MDSLLILIHVLQDSPTHSVVQNLSSSHSPSPTGLPYGVLVRHVVVKLGLAASSPHLLVYWAFHVFSKQPPYTSLSLPSSWLPHILG